jgi:AAA domain
VNHLEVLVKSCCNVNIQNFSSMHPLMEKIFVNKDYYWKGASLRPFRICIVDEASQCVEPEMLIPFRLSFKKLIMIGDHCQLSGKSNQPSLSHPITRGHGEKWLSNVIFSALKCTIQVLQTSPVPIYNLLHLLKQAFSDNISLVAFHS